ncbi:DUF2630 family protein [Rhodococcus sp. BP-349]|uniref:DUF2630 family protein n=1 Tax=unclassified Rhodococcus (in: high G+C Gram-positive bacteria) TaxID=192944 RepID=UPI001C9A53CE|nr:MULTISPECIES: DUF2630 family protein [unclassified Rhodococcus (in: high G+C Gram-positive bacteria)]MBY6538280.1 DUF2630 family protein [Rhodococcus sp. BP-363]MBY6542617.1 DUF2630 family protein [Rhodococcus sp. BP-369]MBY6561847.1 DUF2630 family protein [Rhodococcus sp. BP-370]MBY6576139.1 DUF2630 family protein [Rhodococcus sp. BP-364]MBY6585440.1 DUF2630 family protein [Rhodococcus sp. BP-358]
MSETDIYAKIKDLVDTEHALRSRTEAGELDPGEERAQLDQLEKALDQCWDLLRQRRAKKDAGLSPDDAEAQPVSQVEGYLQ